MPLNAFLTLAGSKQGPIKGSVMQKGREGTIMVIEANHEIFAPISNPGSGAAVGKRVHKPFVITKELDKSSPLLYTAMVSMEELTVFELKFFAPVTTGGAGGGLEKQNYTVRLKGGIITGIRFLLPNTKDPVSVKLNPCEEIEFTYQSIEWTWVDGGITATDQWQ